MLINNIEAASKTNCSGAESFPCKTIKRDNAVIAINNGYITGSS